MSAQKTPRRGFVSAIAGLIGFSALSGLLVTVMVAPAVAVTGITASSTIGIFESLPEYMEISDQRERNEIFANDASGNQLIATIFSQNRETVSYDEISPYALQAAVDGEDRRFFEHGGVDVASVIRAALGNAGAGGVESGASTLTMQLVKNINMQDALEKDTIEARQAAYAEATATTFDRKLSEMKYAIGIEKKYTKKEILTAYLNIAFFGSNTYGIQAAAQRYYSVDAKDLTLTQATSLIAIVQYPGLRSLDDPEHYPANQERRDVILYAMYDLGSITEQEYNDAIATPVDDTTLLPSAPTSGCIAADPNAKWFCDYVVKSVKDFEFLGKDEDEREANWERGGYKLYTTLDLELNAVTQNSTYVYAPNTEERFQLGSATSAVEPGTGRVLAMTQNKDFNDTLEGGGPTTTAVNFNTSFEYGGSSGFQSGSTYKLFTLLEWLNQGKGVNERVEGAGRTLKLSTFHDSCQPEVTSGPDYTFRNNSGSTGIWTIRAGTVSSINGVFFSMAQQLDLCAIHTLAADMGVERADGKPLSHLLSTIIGTNEITPLSLATAYATVAAQGLSCKPIIIDRATGPGGVDLGGQAKDCRQVLTPDVANTAVDVLKGVMKGSASVGDGIPIFGKTGTTNEANQTWIAGSSSKVTVVTWVGNIKYDYNILRTSYGGVRGEILRNMIMRDALKNYGARFGGDDWPGPAQALLNGASAPTVPDVRGQSPEAAKALLEGLGFTFADGGQVDSELEAGRVTNTEPAAGSPSAKGSTITVFTSRGNKVAMPDVVADGQSYTFNQARSALQSAGFTSVSESCVVVTSTGPNPSPGPGTPLDPRIDRVQSSNPGAGNYMLPTDPITLAVGKASC